ncbi:hypothetical protein PAAG_01762 [Paracoccidioides lutzii Pb01]|uniref:Uncharacterized protein n=1 Tax=Paracoccidioides lutzii (strain ATCC MYA-826 / Pb01) TaxID=502779 RepID=C1GTB7_PARBA|nr:hypothetical protein PAAG_01762 [Paracoccidioides lutzii Pb01]EEH39300.2 hypothetical protein PAAG_01762 [Paracoccidioides lutzii Pb01]
MSVIVQVSDIASDSDDTTGSNVFVDSDSDGCLDDSDLGTDDEAEQSLRTHKQPPPPPEQYLQAEADVDVSPLWKDGQRIPGIGTVSSLETLWKQYFQVYMADTGHPIDDLVIAQAQDVIALVADEKKLSWEKRPKGTMYVDDLAEFARVMLATTDMLFLIGWLLIQPILFCHLAGITGNRPAALLELRYRHLQLTLIRNPLGGTPRLTTESLLNLLRGTPYIFLLGMLFHIKAFKYLLITGAETLYDLGVLEGLNHQKVPLRNDLDDKFVFGQASFTNEVLKNEVPDGKYSVDIDETLHRIQLPLKEAIAFVAGHKPTFAQNPQGYKGLEAN